MDKVIVLTEEQQSRILNEATDGKFSTDELESIRTYAGKVRYCKEHLGQPIGNGSSRMVFQIDDERCLKLAKNEKGTAQNRVESEGWKQRYDIFPRIFSADYDNDMWIECEYVLPAKRSDFKACLGVTFDEFVDFCYTTFARYSRYGGWRHIEMSDERYSELTDELEFFSDLEDYLCNSQEENADIVAIRNWGLAKRDGGAMPVLLDHGLTQDVYNTYYRR